MQAAQKCDESRAVRGEPLAIHHQQLRRNSEAELVHARNQEVLAWFEIHILKNHRLIGDITEIRIARAGQKRVRRKAGWDVAVLRREMIDLEDRIENIALIWPLHQKSGAGEIRHFQYRPLRQRNEPFRSDRNHRPNDHEIIAVGLRVEQSQPTGEGDVRLAGRQDDQ